MLSTPFAPFQIQSQRLAIECQCEEAQGQESLVEEAE